MDVCVSQLSPGDQLEVWPMGVGTPSVAEVLDIAEGERFRTLVVWETTSPWQTPPKR